MAISVFISCHFIFSHSVSLIISVWWHSDTFMCQGISKVYPLNSTSKSLGILPSTWWHSSGGSPGATTHPHRHNAKSPCQLDMTHATLHTHHCDNPVIINTNLSASARRAEVLWSWRKGEGGGRKKGRHTKYRSWYCHLSDSGIREQVWMWLCTQDIQTRRRLIPAPPSALTAVVFTWRRRR